KPGARGRRVSHESYVIAVGSELRNEGPCFTGDPALVLALILFSGIVTAAMCAPTQGIPLCTALIGGAGVRPAVRAWLRWVLRRAAIDADELVAQRSPLRDIQNGIV